MNPHVLVVDDSLSVRMDLQNALKTAGFTVTMCDTGAAARRALRSGPYALIILDVLLPDANGIEIVQEARAYPPTAKAPIIMLSGEAEVQHRIRGLTSGASEYIGKPYGTPYVVKRVRQLTDPKSIAPAGSSSSSGPLRILLVDDSPTFLNVLADGLRLDGHDVILSKSGSEALSFLAVQPVDGVVLDVFMPGISGLETCRRIKSTPAWAHMPVMMLTGREDSIAKAMGLRAGVDDYVVKSTDVSAMTVRIGDLLKRKRADRGTAKASLAKAPDGAREGSRGAAFDRSGSPPLGTNLSRDVMNTEMPFQGVEGQREATRTMTPLQGTESQRDAPRMMMPFHGAEGQRDAVRAGSLPNRSSASRRPDSTRDPGRTGGHPDRSGAGRGPASMHDSGHFALTQEPPSSSSRGPDSPRDSSKSSPSSRLFDQVVELCGLPLITGRNSLKRAFERAGVDVALLTPESLARALPEICQTLKVFLQRPEAQRHVAAIASLTRKTH